MQRKSQNRRYVQVPRNTQIINPRLLVNPDLDSSNVDHTLSQADTQFNEKITASGGLFESFADILSIPEGKRRGEWENEVLKRR